MADKKISALTAATTPLAGTEVLPIVQGAPAATVKVSVANLTAGRAVSTGALSVVAGNATLDNGYFLNGKLVAGTSVGMLRRNSSDKVAIDEDGYGVVMGFGGRYSFAGGGDFTTNIGNIIFGAAAKGVNFTANTPAAGMTSQLLNWYEEGTWTPVYVAGTGTLGAITYQNVQGRYVRIGRQVTVTGGFYTSAFAAGTGSGDLLVGGLPFANGGTVNPISVGDSRLFTTNNPTGGQVNLNATTVTLYYRTTANGGINNLQVSDASNGAAANLVYFTATYQI